jgi:hypothetical protein
VSTARCARRPHFARTAARHCWRESASSRSCDTTLAEMAAALTRQPRRCADRLRALACQSLRLRCSCLRVWAFALCHAKHRRLSWRVGRDSDIQLSSLRLRSACVRPPIGNPAVATISATRTVALRKHRCAPLRSLKHRRHAEGQILTSFARCACRDEEDCSRYATPRGMAALVGHCCHEAPALLTVLVPARLWQCLA